MFCRTLLSERSLCWDCVLAVEILNLYLRSYAEMGAGQSSPLDSKVFEKPSEKHQATLYYFPGRGLADQIRWMLAVSNISFVQKLVKTRERFVKMAERQLLFGQLPLLQIDGLEIVQSQAIVRYIAKRGNLLGTCTKDELECDMIAETVRDLLPYLTKLPALRTKGINYLHV